MMIANTYYRRENERGGGDGAMRTPAAGRVAIKACGWERGGV